jgi:DNA-directed RNA polymerase subunit RPC12/RpoP
MRDESRIKDWRSTGRRKARRELYTAFVPYSCVDCGKTSKEPPKDAPHHFEEIWPEENRVLDSQLQADHESKDYTNNELDYINWRCVSCHQKLDRTTAKGVATKSMNYW